jgi:hypothetical protein
MQVNTRNADLSTLADMLRNQQVRKIDVVAPATSIVAKDGMIVVKGTEPILDSDGVTMGDGVYQPTAVFDEGVAEKLGIPVAYLRKMRVERPDLYDANVNGWLHGRKPLMRGTSFDKAEVIREGVEPDGRSFLFRGFKGEDGETGIGRALLSNSYKIVDNLDVLTAALTGIRQAGVDASVVQCDLSDRRMYVKIAAPGVMAYAPELLAGYRNPLGGDQSAAAEARWRQHSGYAPGEEPVVFAGFVIANSEVGNGAFSITPQITVKVCKNGLTISKDVLRAVHLGGKQDDGVVRWSDETQRLTVELVTSKTADAVKTFLDVDYVKAVVASLTETASKPVDPLTTVQAVGKRLQFDKATTDGILDHFIRGGQITAGGVMQAVTSYAQTVDSPDAAFDLEAAAVRAMEVAYAL